MPEKITDLSESDYHKSSGMGEGQYLTRSMIQTYIQDPALFNLRYIERDPEVQVEENSGMAFGTYLESMLLGDDDIEWRLKPSKCINAKGEEVEWSLRSGQKVIGSEITTREWVKAYPRHYTQEDYDKAAFLRRRFSETAYGKYFLKNINKAEKQTVIRWTDEETGIIQQVRLDFYLPKMWAGDLKNTAAPLEKFSTTADKYGYALQQVVYSKGIKLLEDKQLPFFFAVAESTGLKRARCISLHNAQLDWAEKQYRAALRGIADSNYQARDFDSTSPMAVELPAYLLYQYEEER